MAIKRKLRKLFRDPKLFFSDMLIKHRKKLDRLKPIKKYNGKNQFTVVSAVYGVEKYLDDYFKSLVNQRLDFKKHIHLILVDDGSLDSSAEVIKRWQKKYPDNITYLYKENGGQASARNLGIEYVKTKWVTFIDPDDFIDRNYFFYINNYLEKKQNDIAVVACNYIFYFEKNNLFKNNHPLNYKFINEVTEKSCSDLGDYIQMATNSTILLTSVFLKNGLNFDCRVKPNFEDGHLLSKYLFYVRDKKIAFLRDSKYFYRKREDETSALDTAWQDKRKYDDVLKYGYLDLLNFYKNKIGYVPAHIQKQVLYDIIWYFKKLINNNTNFSDLDDEQISNFHYLLESIFKNIDNEIILNYKMWYLYKVCILSFYKNWFGFNQRAYIDRIVEQNNKKKLSLSYIKPSCSDDVVEIRHAKGRIVPISIKEIPINFGRRIIGKRVFLNLDVIVDMKSIAVYINNRLATLDIDNGKTFYKPVQYQDIKSRLMEKEQEDDIWLLMDRDIQADDNAEHLYRYIKNNHPDKKIFFVLRKSSHDWGRLKKEGFNLLDFASKEHEKMLLKANKIISSHANKYVHNYFDDHSISNKSFVFLQHGIIKHDLSSWLNTKKNMDLFVTSSYLENYSIANPDSPYIFTDNIVKLTGLPRHDKLWTRKNKIKQEKIILIMPTWRRSIVGENIGKGDSFAINDNFKNTQYFKYWKKFLHSKELFNLSQKNSFHIIYAPHKNIEAYLPLFELPEYIECWRASAERSMQDLFLKSSFLITDYSSVAFEMAYLNKTTIYYQFDEREVFTGDHIIEKGDFEYELDGFGPKVTSFSKLILELEKLCSNDGVIEDKYLERIRSTFAFQDSNNCSRVYYQINSLNENKYQSLFLDDDWINNIENLRFIYKKLDFLYNKYTKISSYLQRQIFNDVAWYFKELVNYEAKLENTDKDEIKKIHFYLKNIFKYIDDDVVANAKIWALYKICILGFYKKNYDIKRSVYIDNIEDKVSFKSIRISYIKCLDRDEIIKIVHGNTNIIPITPREEPIIFANRIIGMRVFIELNVFPYMNEISIYINDKDMPIDIDQGRNYYKFIKYDQIVSDNMKRNLSKNKKDL